jgi:hypothetical protein
MLILLCVLILELLMYYIAYLYDELHGALWFRKMNTGRLTSPGKIVTETYGSYGSGILLYCMKYTMYVRIKVKQLA